jgi:hypothetical protein
LENHPERPLIRPKQQMVDTDEGQLEGHKSLAGGSCFRSKMIAIGRRSN